MLTAQVLPATPNGIADARTNTSKLRTESALYVTAAVGKKELADYTSEENANMTKELKAEVGKTLGLGGAQTTTRITVDRLHVFPGEKIGIDIRMDNSTCGKAVKSYKFKLNRTIDAYTAKGNEKTQLSKTEYVHTTSETGCGPKVVDERKFEFPIDKFEDAGRMGDITRIPSVLRPLVQQFSHNIKNDLFCVKYSLDVFVKHDAWNEFGMGNFVSFPITVHSPQAEFKELSTPTEHFQNMGKDWLPPHIENKWLLATQINDETQAEEIAMK